MNKIEFVDTHCHIHEIGQIGDVHIQSMWKGGGFNSVEPVILDAQHKGVKQLICVGTSLEDSILATRLAAEQSNCWASVGIHPHESKDYIGSTDKLQQFSDLIHEEKVIAVGECGLDYYYNHSPSEYQESILRKQIELALEYRKPLIFHVRAAFDDFWKIFDSYEGVRGVIHSFSAGTKELEDVLQRGLYVGLNGIMTFTKDKQQLAAAKKVPIDRLLMETDAPFLTPSPFRGMVCQPKHVRVVAEFLADLRGEKLEDLARQTTTNAKKLFGI